MTRAGNRRQKKLADKPAKKAGLVRNHSPASARQQKMTVQEAVDLGLQLHSAGNLSKAEQVYQQILQAEPNQPVALHYLGVIASQVGKNDVAVELIKQALAGKPEYAEARNNLGFALQEQGKIDDAIVSFNEAISIKPDYADAYNNLGNALHVQGKLDDAVYSYRKALEINPNYAKAHYNVGIVYSELGELDDAVASYRKALAIKPDYAEAHSNLGNALSEQGKLDDAVASYRKALDIKPDSAEAHSNLGNVLSEQGKLDDAVASYRKALAIKPDYAEAHRHLAHITKPSEGDEDLKSMERAYELASSSDQDRMHLAFGLGKAFEDLQDYERAFEYLAEGNRIKRETIGYSTDNDIDFFEKTMAAFDNSLFRRSFCEGCSDKSPIFVLGMPRSGTTLIEQILASHPHVHGAGELGILKQILKSHFSVGKKNNYPENIQFVDKAQFEHAGKQYVDEIKRKSPDSRFIVNKTPDNFKYIGLIKLILPNSRVIHCRRDPLDTCLSIFKNYFTGAHEYAYDLVDLGTYYKLYGRLMEHWHKVMPDFIYDVHYEKVISDQVAQTKALLNYCGLEWNDACLEFYKSDRPVKTASFAQVRKPIYTDSVQSWKRYERQLKPLHRILNGRP